MIRIDRNIRILNHLFLKLNISHLYISSLTFFNISIYPPFVTRLPDDGHMSGHDM